MIGFPESASGTLVSGGTMANIICLTVVRNVFGEMAGVDVHEEGVAALVLPMRVYGSDQMHSCHQKAVEVLGLGQKALHKVASNEQGQLDLDALREAVKADRSSGINPICVIANAGTVNTGAIDDLHAIADFCAEEGMWFHVDGCIGALIAIAPQNQHLVSGMEQADSVALDPHKWLHAPFEVGCAIVRDAHAHLNTFTLTPEYLENAQRGVASGEWLFDYGLQTSRGFRALKVWLSLQEHGVDKFGRLIDQNIAQARYLTELIEAHPALEMVAPTNINIVCFRYNPNSLDSDQSNLDKLYSGSHVALSITEARLKVIYVEIMQQMQETGVAAVSDTTIRGTHCLRVAITNHRTQRADLDLLVQEVARLGALLQPNPTVAEAA